MGYEYEFDDSDDFDDDFRWERQARLAEAEEEP